MKVFLSLVGIYLLFIFSTCSPIPVRYFIISNKLTDSSNKKYLNRGQQELLCTIQQNHYPNGKLKNYIDINMMNYSNDSLLINSTETFSFVSKFNLIDTSQFKDLSANDNTRWILPRSQKRISHVYWSSTFDASIKEFVSKAQEENLSLIIRYSNNKKQKIIDTMEFFPDLSRFKR